MESSETNPAESQVQGKSTPFRKVTAHHNGYKIWLKEADEGDIGRFIAERQADDQGAGWLLICELQDRWNAHDALVAALKKLDAACQDLGGDALPVWDYVAPAYIRKSWEALAVVLAEVAPLVSEVSK